MMVAMTETVSFPFRIHQKGTVVVIVRRMRLAWAERRAKGQIPLCVQTLAPSSHLRCAFRLSCQFLPITMLSTAMNGNNGMTTSVGAPGSSNDLRGKIEKICADFRESRLGTPVFLAD